MPGITQFLLVIVKRKEREVLLKMMLLASNFGSSSNVRDPVVQMHDAQTLHTSVSYDALILDASLRQSLMTVRSLGRRGKRVAALENKSVLKRSKHVPTFTSRWCQEEFLAPGYEREVGAFWDRLKQVIDETGARVLISSSDGTIAVLRKYRAEIERRGLCLALAKEAALEIAIKKERTLAVAEELGLYVPREVLLTMESDVSMAVHEIGLPAVVKPTESWLWGQEQGSRLNCKLVTTVEEARVAVRQLTQYGGKVLYQQFLSGSQESISMLYAQGEIYARFAQWTRRAHPPLGGVSTYRQSIELPEDTTAQAERLIRAIDLEGYAQVQFRRDQCGKPYLMEINPRLTSGIELAVRAGVDFPYLVYQWACEERIDRIKGYRTGGRMRYLEGDFLTTLQTFAECGHPGVTPPTRAVAEFIGAFFVPTGYDYFDWQDPYPAWTAACETLDNTLYRLKRLLPR
jgi:predicted ATP-grasp superfamily ATP-dependent carboligase